MNVELVAQMFKNYQSNVLFHLEGRCLFATNAVDIGGSDTSSDGESEGSHMMHERESHDCRDLIKNGVDRQPILLQHI